VDSRVSGLSKAELASAFEEEMKMQSQDKLAVETAEAKNALESYCLDMRSKLQSDSDLLPYSTQTERDAFSTLSNSVEDWLYNEGANETKGVFIDKLNELKKIASPAVDRKSEDFKREKNMFDLEQTLSHYKTTINESRYEHIEKEEKDKILAECQTIKQTVDQLLQQQKSLPKPQ